MEKIQVEYMGQVAVITLKNGVTNALSPELVGECLTALDQIKKEAAGLVLCGGTRFLSIGLDLPSLLPLDRTQMSDFWKNFNRLVFDLYTLPFGTVCAVEGHAVAGGNILALTCDLRLATHNDGKKIGLNEIKLGVPVPYLADMILRQVVGDRAASKMILGGEFLSPSEAYAIGLVDEVHPEDRVRESAVKRVQEMSALPTPAFAEIKANRVEEVTLRYRQNRETKNKSFLDCWFDEKVQKTLKEAAKKF